MKRTVQMGAQKGHKTKTMYEVQQLAARPLYILRNADGSLSDSSPSPTWTGSSLRYRSHQKAEIKMVELRLLDEHGNQYRVHRVRVRKT